MQKLMGQNQQLRQEVIRLYKTLYYMGKEYPKGSLWFHERLKNAFARNRGEQDEQKVRELIKRGEYVVKELEMLYRLKKYRAMKNRFIPTMANCSDCTDRPPRIKTAKDGRPRCPDCFIKWFEQDIHETIMRTRMFGVDDRIGIGVSGGKDSTVLAHVLSRLNQRHSYGLDLVLLCIDEGIKGYRDDSIREVHKNERDLKIPLVLVSYRELYGWTMDEIVARIGRKNNCTFCGVFRRQALDRAAIRAGATKLATGHNADDAAETVLMNILRGDVGRLQRGSILHQQDGNEAADDESLPRVKPLKYAFEKDIVMYAHFGKLNYFSTECIYAPNAYRMNARSFVKELERINPQAILDIVLSGERLRLRATVIRPRLSHCNQCGYITSQKYCKACLLLYGLNNNEPSLSIARKSKHLHELDLPGRVEPTTPNNGNGKTTPERIQINNARVSSECSGEKCLKKGVAIDGCCNSDSIDF